ncbi:hypothetical protein [Chryseolinea sp. H1M3-3]|uniref:hypothetical protein n=1 Tax=Chryseolinea sp. H1M3-3 TaxID=3034144 RepID=UPI0023EB0F60|nr:hypothetical protein [Chryseolinea sp. H1M3-3]
MKKIIAAVFLALLFIELFGQSEKTMKRLNSVRFKSLTVASPKGPPGGYLDFTHKGNKLAVGSMDFHDGDYLSTNLSVNEDLNVRIQFLNPLLYNVTVKLSEIESPSTSALDSFLKQMTGTFGPVSEVGSFKSGARVNKAAPKIFPSVILKDFLLTISDDRYIKKAYYTDIAEKVSGIESFLYGDITNVCDCSGNGNVLAVMSNAVLSLSKETSFTNFDISSQNLIDLKTETNDCLNKVKRILEALQQSLKDAKNHVITNPPTAKDLSTFNATIDSYAQATAKWVSVFTDKDMKTMSDRINAFGSLVDAARKFIIEKKHTGLISNEYVPYGSQKLQRGKDIGVSVTIISLDLSNDLISKPKDTLNINLTVVKNKPQLEISTGIALLPDQYTFNNYFVNSSNGIHTIANTTTTKIVLPTLFLNYYVHLRKLDINLILPQVGVATGKEYPTFLIGAGFSEFNRFSITTGAALLFNQTLRGDFSEGMNLTDESVIKDITKAYYNKFDASWYVSLNYRLTN